MLVDSPALCTVAEVVDNCIAEGENAISIIATNLPEADDIKSSIAVVFGHSIFVPMIIFCLLLLL